MYQPHLNLRGSKFLFRLGALDVRELASVQAVLVQRAFSDDNFKCLVKFREVGLKIVYDLDDNIWALTTSNPHKQNFDSLVGKGYFHKCASQAHVLTVSTQGLKSACRMGFQLPQEIYVVPNGIDFNLFRPKNVVENNELTIIGWGGSNTHNNDVKDAFSIIPEILDEYPNLRMEIVGAPATERIIENALDKNGNPIRRYVFVSSAIGKHRQSLFRPWVPIAEYPNRLASWNWDIFLAPIEDTRFNRSKSAIKMLEAAALKKPCLASDVQPYAEFAALGGDDLKWLLCRTPSEWKRKIITLVNEPERRKVIGEKMYDVAYRFFNAATISENWKYVFQQAIKA